ncbi:unnamed protein product, partial [Iphiclides podalirius]
MIHMMRSGYCLNSGTRNRCSLSDIQKYSLLSLGTVVGKKTCAREGAGVGGDGGGGGRGGGCRAVAVEQGASRVQRAGPAAAEGQLTRMVVDW